MLASGRLEEPKDLAPSVGLLVSDAGESEEKHREIC